MRRIALPLVAVLVLAGLVTPASPEPGRTGEGAAAYVTQIPPGFRDWTLISVAHEEGSLRSFAAVLGNDVVIKAYREGKLPYPDGSIIAALHYTHTASDENNQVFGQAQSFVPGSPTNTQFMVKDSRKYAATGGWGFGHFNSDGTPGNEALMKTCFPCHEKGARDFVFTRYAH